jgi:integrase
VASRITVLRLGIGALHEFRRLDAEPRGKREQHVIARVESARFDRVETHERESGRCGKLPRADVPLGAHRIPSNPVSMVRKPSARRSKPVCTLAPEMVECLRVAMPSERDRRLVSVLAYSGLRPGEALALEATDVGKKTISVTRAIKLDGPGDTKTHKARSMSLLGVLAEDLAGIDIGLIFPGHDGKHWTHTAYGNWRERVWQTACEKVGIGTITTTTVNGKTKRSYTGATPYDLRHSFASLMFHEQRNPLEIADMMGHSPQVLFSTYAHVIAELRGASPISAEEQIQAARSRIRNEDG